jgi:hypothetical protein
MASITITIPDTAINRVQDGFAYELGWTSELGVTKAQFTKQQVIKFMKQTVKNAEINQSNLSTSSTINSDIDAISIT